MKWLFKSADKYLEQSNWKDLALIKICMFSLGIFVGMQIPKKFKMPSAFLTFGTFVTTYIALMAKYFKIVGHMITGR